MKNLELENILLRGFVRMVIEENECKCDFHPFYNGNPCNVCFGIRLLEILDGKDEDGLLENIVLFHSIIEKDEKEKKQ